MTFSNTSLDTDDNHPQCVIYDFIVEGVIMGLLCLFGFCGNALSMVCLSRDRSRTATPFLLASLEAADTLFLVTVLILRVFNTVSMYFDFYYHPLVWAYAGKYVYPFAMIAETGTVYITLLVTLNRYVSVCKPQDAPQMCSVAHARQHVLFVIAFSVIFNIPRFLEYDIVDDNPNRFQISQLGDNFYYQIIYKNTAYFLVMFSIPLIVLVYLNFKLIMALREAKRRRVQLQCAQSRSEDDITLMLIVVVLVFIVCQTPALFTQILYNSLSPDKTLCPAPFFYHARISDLLVVVNSSLNFIIYCFCSKMFREILKSLLCAAATTETTAAGRTAATHDRTKSIANHGYQAVPTNITELRVNNGACHNGDVSNAEELRVDDSKI